MQVANHFFGVEFFSISQFHFSLVASHKLGGQERSGTVRLKYYYYYARENLCNVSILGQPLFCSVHRLGRIYQALLTLRLTSLSVYTAVPLSHSILYLCVSLARPRITYKIYIKPLNYSYGPILVYNYLFLSVCVSLSICV